MSSFRIGQNNPNSYRFFSNDASEMFEYTMNNIVDSMYDYSMNQQTDGKFKSICLSGLRTEDNTGGGPDQSDAYDADGYMNIVVRPLAPFASAIPDPRQFSDKDVVIEAIDLHRHVFSARSDFQNFSISPVGFGQIIECYFENGSIQSSNFSSLRFSDPKVVQVDQSYVDLSLIEGLKRIETMFLSNPFLTRMTEPVANQPKNVSPQQALFAQRLKASLSARNLPLKVTSWGRTPTEQAGLLIRIYTGSGRPSFMSNYPKSGPKYEKFILAGDKAGLIKLLESKNPSGHGSGLAIDIRSNWYTSEQLTIVLSVIRSLGGNPFLEPSKDGKCFEDAGRSAGKSKPIVRLFAPGGGKGEPCYNEHVHIDFPRSYV